MVDLCINFTFYGVDTLHNINEEMQERIRRKVAEIFSNAKFGEVVTVIDEARFPHYETQYAIPIADNYYGVENEMFMGFRFVYPLAHGDLSLLAGDGISELYNFLPSINPDLHLLIRIVFIHHDV